MCVLAPRPDGWGYAMCCLMLCSTPLCFHGSTAPVWCNSSWSRDRLPGRLWLRPVRPAGMLLPGGGSRLILRIMTPCTLTRSSRVGSLAFWSPYGDSPHTYHGAFTLRLTCPDGCRRALASGAVLSVLSYYCQTYGVGAYSHHDEADDNLADGRTVKKTRGRCEQQRHQGRSTDSHLYRHRIGSGGQVT